MILWIILPDAVQTEDRAYLVGFLKSFFEKVTVTRVAKSASSCAVPSERADVILNAASCHNPEFPLFLDKAAEAWGVPVSPQSHGSWRTEDKRTYLEDFADVIPPSQIVHRVAELDLVRDAFGGDVVIKAPFGSCGSTVARVRGVNDYPKAQDLLTNSPGNTRALIVQPFMEGFSRGDKRIVLQRMPDNSFEITAHIARIPAEGGWKSNVGAGGRSVPTDLSAAEIDFVHALAPRAGIDNVAFDIAEHEGRLYYIEHNQGFGGIIDHDLEHGTCNVAHTATFLSHIAQHGHPAAAHPIEPPVLATGGLS